jgi:AcrR family transcriptional regulator
MSATRDRSEAELAVLDATHRLLETVPLGELSVSKVIREAGISRATFYFYFSSKFAVLAALVARLADELNGTFDSRVSDADLERGVEDRLRAIAAVWRDNRSLLHAIAENWQGAPELRTLWLGVIDRLTDLVTAEICDVRQSADPSAIRSQAAALAWAIERYLYVAGLHVYADIDDEAAVLPAIKRIWLGVLLGPRLVDDRVG